MKLNVYNIVPKVVKTSRETKIGTGFWLTNEDPYGNSRSVLTRSRSNTDQEPIYVPQVEMKTTKDIESRYKVKTVI